MGPKTLILTFVIVCASVYAIYKSFKSPLWGLALMLFLTSYSAFIERLIPAQIPYAFLCDAYCAALFYVIVMVNPKPHAGKSISSILILFLAYIFIEIFNVNSTSLMGSFWVFVRTYLARYLFFYICLNVLDNYKDTKTFLRMLFIIILGTGFYALKQKYLGFYGFEMVQFWGEGARTNILKQLEPGGGVGYLYRVFSTYSDATACGYSLGIGALIGTALCFISESKKETTFYLLGSATLLWALVFPVSRAAYVFLVLAMIILTALINLRYFAVTLISLVIIFLAVNMSDNPSAMLAKAITSPTEDASFGVRMENRRAMESTLWTLLGHGLGSGGTTGQKFGRELGIDLATIPRPSDSLWVLMLYEVGIIGTLLFALLYMTGLIKSLHNYCAARVKKVKIIMALPVAIICSSFLFWYTQGTYFMYFYCALLAIVANFKKIEKSVITQGD